MGNNCSCLRVKSKETEISINDENKIYYFLNSIQHANPKFLTSIILIQSHVRGLITRIQMNNNPFFSGSFLPIMDPDLQYIFPTTSHISDEEIQYVFNSFKKVNDNIPIICLQTIEYSNGCQYYGEWNQVNNQKHGRGILKWQDGLTYYGQFKMNKANGKGKLVIKQGEEYDGDWIDNKANGLGVYKSKIAKYEGKWKDDKQDGIGTETWSNGVCYTGEFKNGQKTGNGKCRYIDGSTYTGEFLNNKFHGKGLYIWADKREYKGDWKFDKMEGEGVFKWPDGRKYIGHYKDDKKDGYGIFEWPGGKKYKGHWRKGKPHGEGEFYNPKEKAWQKGKWGNAKKERESMGSFTIEHNNSSSNNLVYNGNVTNNSRNSEVSNQKIEIKV